MLKEGSFYAEAHEGGGLGLGCSSAQGRWWEVRGATLAAFLARVNFCSCAPPTPLIFRFFLFFFSLAKK